MDVALQQFYTWLQQAGLLGGLIVFIIGLHKEWWIMGSQYRRQTTELEFYKKLAERGTSLAESATDVAQRVVKP